MGRDLSHLINARPFLNDSGYTVAFITVITASENEIPGSASVAAALVRTRSLSSTGDLLSFHVLPGSVRSFRAHVKRVSEQFFSGALVRLRAQRVCEAMLNGSMDVFRGVRKMARLYHLPRGDTVIPDIFLGLESETDDVPTPDRYQLYSPEFLQDKLRKMELYGPSILEEAQAFLRGSE